MSGQVGGRGTDRKDTGGWTGRTQVGGQEGWQL